MGELTQNAGCIAWKRNGDKWQQTFPWLTAHQCKTCVKGVPTIELFLGCRICAEAGVIGPFAKNNYCRKQFVKHVFTQHQRSRMHQAALQGRCVDELGVDAAPTLDQFRDVYESLRRRAQSKVARRLKLRKMQWCLSEGARMMDRWFLQDAKSICIMQDGRKGRHLVRFKASDEGLNVRTGVLQQTRMIGGAMAIQQATMTCIRKFCTPDLNPPGKKCKGKLDKRLFKKIVNHVEVLVADAAGDEQKGGRMLRGDFQDKNDLPSLKLVLRDRPHAARRLLKRPWSADPSLSQIVDGVAFKKRSICQLTGRIDIRPMQLF